MSCDPQVRNFHCLSDPSTISFCLRRRLRRSLLQRLFARPRGSEEWSLWAKEVAENHPMDSQAMSSTLLQLKQPMRATWMAGDFGQIVRDHPYRSALVQAGGGNSSSSQGRGTKSRGSRNNRAGSFRSVASLENHNITT